MLVFVKYMGKYILLTLYIQSINALLTVYIRINPANIEISVQNVRESRKTI